MSTIQAPAAPPGKPAERVIDANIDRSVGDVACDGGLLVRGNVLDGRTVSAGGSIHVLGVIQAATVEAAGDIRADGGITGREKARLRAGYQLHARYVTNAHIDAESDVVIAAEVLHSRITCGGKLIVENGSLIGGQFTGVGGIVCKNLGSPGCVRTVVEAGVDRQLQEEAAHRVREVEARRKRASRIRDIVTPLLRNQKALNPQQKDKATELLFEADTAEAENAEALKALRERYQAFESRAVAEVRVLGTIFPGTVVRLMDLEAPIETSIKGPVTVRIRRAGPDRHICVVDDRGGALDLHARPCFDAAALEALRRILVKTAA